jgi:hypothetical protein
VTEDGERLQDIVREIESAIAARDVVRFIDLVVRAPARYTALHAFRTGVWPAVVDGLRAMKAAAEAGDEGAADRLIRVLTLQPALGALLAGPPAAEHDA